MAGTNPEYTVIVKDGQDVAAAKKFIEDKGGKITKEYTLFDGWDVVFPKDSVSTLETGELIGSVEPTGAEFKIQ